MRLAMQRGFAIGGVRRAAGLAVAALLLAPAFATADTGDIIAPQHNPPTAADGWQAGTCKTDLPECTPETESQFYTQAAGHPNVGLTQFIVKNEPFLGLPGTQQPVGILKTLRVELPVGLSVNPQATPQCELASFEAEQCAVSAPGSMVGTSAVTAAELGVPVPALDGLTKVPVYNLVPKDGQPARFGFRILANAVYLEADVDWSGDYHEGFTIAVPESPIGKILKNRFVFDGRPATAPSSRSPAPASTPPSPASSTSTRPCYGQTPKRTPTPTSPAAPPSSRRGCPRV